MYKPYRKCPKAALISINSDVYQCEKRFIPQESRQNEKKLMSYKKLPQQEVDSGYPFDFVSLDFSEMEHVNVYPKDHNNSMQTAIYKSGLQRLEKKKSQQMTSAERTFLIQLSFTYKAWVSSSTGLCQAGGSSVNQT
ncbi:hypothetical protein STEG23_017407, partial [Scotinomys teguina]